MGLWRWHRTDPRCQECIGTVVRKNINTANNVLTNALPRLADELVTMAMERSVKPYSRIAAIHMGITAGVLFQKLPEATDWDAPSQLAQLQAALATRERLVA